MIKWSVLKTHRLGFISDRSLHLLLYFKTAFSCQFTACFFFSIYECIHFIIFQTLNTKAPSSLADVFDFTCNYYFPWHTYWSMQISVASQPTQTTSWTINNKMTKHKILERTFSISQTNPPLPHPSSRPKKLHQHLHWGKNSLEKKREEIHSVRKP